ncbi:hypothetical protein Rhe02_63910 [Rhizocola hellebori]|uniref:Aminoglycoside phosphotransferase domain-containing protein n=1 Tax=Rhizocola hellebori TaxID=1392758 RepID=A0A8J3QCP2_9ACTN|nr:aminoglycoside phosphotransferase family protein [Rhizocola hellebori]GIH08324.1 hypothetical protein Rhe02_63910 [Rhizocola hellebori]
MASPSLAEVHDVVQAHLPGYRVRSVEQLGSGLDNIAYKVNGELVVRFSNDPDQALLGKQARLLSAVAGVSPLPVPEPVFVAAEHGCLAYFKLPGVPLLEVPRHRRSEVGTSIAARLGELLAVLHASPAQRWADLVDVDDQPLAQWQREAAETYGTVAEWIPASLRPDIETFLHAPSPPARRELVFSHNDLGIEHVLIEPASGTPTGIIDWGDAAITDPAHDFGLIYRDLGPGALREALDRYPIGGDDVAVLRERAVFYARCSVFEDLAYGLQTGLDRYTEKCLASMDWLFPAGG